MDASFVASLGQHPGQQQDRALSPRAATACFKKSLRHRYIFEEGAAGCNRAQSQATPISVLLQDGKAYFRSEASIRIVDGLGGAWSLFATLARLVPASLRDALYNVIGRNRLRWFGAREQCYLPEPSQADRFLS
jgi:predicted DCC family thiol-disulfide oxidoreductase YuxK